MQILTIAQFNELAIIACINKMKKKPTTKKHGMAKPAKKVKVEKKNLKKGK